MQVIGVLLNAVEDSHSLEFNTFLDAMSQRPIDVHMAREYAESIEMTDYFTYAGSLTTQPCTEGFTWFVVGEPKLITHDQFDLFIERWGGNIDYGTSRHLQELNGRTVYRVAAQAPLEEAPLQLL